MKLLVTGGNGFIGSALCRHCVGDLGWQVVNLDALTAQATLGSVASLAGNPAYRFYHANILDRAAVDAVLAAERPDAILHLAAESHVDRSIDGPMAFVQTNVVGTATLLDAARQYYDGLTGAARAGFRFHHVSTDEVFGSLGPDDAGFLETTPYDPSSPYSASKAASDHLVRAYGRTFGLPVLITNCSNNYGPFHFPEKLIPLMIIKALRGEGLPVYGNGQNVRDWLFVEDHARALALVVSRAQPGESYNIGGNAERSNLSVVEGLCDLLDARLGISASGARRGLIRFVSDRPGHDLRYAIDSRRLHQALGWRPSVTFEEGLARTVDWYLAHEDWWRPLVERGAAERIGRGK